MFDMMIATLTALGYTKADDDADPNALEDTEYMVYMRQGKRMLTLGKGRNGDDGCYTTFYFTLDSGEFLYHGTFQSED
jgi:hypothetical protein